MRHRTFATALACSVALFRIGHASPAAASGVAPSSCAPDSVTNADLRALLTSVRFERDSSHLDFARGRQRSIRRNTGRTITDARLCDRGHVAWFTALGGHAPESPPEQGTIELIRIGSYYLIFLRGDANLVLTSSDFTVLGVIGFDND